MNRIRSLIILLVVLTFNVACQSKEALSTELPPQETELPPQETLPHYPEPPAAAQEQYPMPGEDGLAFNIIITPGQMPDPPADAPEPMTGKGSASGLMVSISKNILLPLNSFYLAPGAGESKDIAPPINVGPQVDKGDVMGNTDETGVFYLNDIPPGNYYFIAWEPLSWAMAVTSPEDQSYRMIQISPDKKHPLGIIYIP